MKTNRIAGFTLIELMIAVVVVAILASIAVPSYLHYVQSARREEAKKALVQLSQYMENFYAMNMTYVGAASDGVPTGFSHIVPSDSDDPYYSLTVENASTTGYLLKATPSATSSQKNDSCGVLSLTRQGVTSAANASCW